MSEKISRKTFLKQVLTGAAALSLFGHSSIAEASTITVNDNLTSEPRVGITPPNDTKCLWIDTSSGNGILKYYNGSSWIPSSSVWG